MGLTEGTTDRDPRGPDGAWPGFHSKPSPYDEPGHRLVFPAPVSAQLRALADEVVAADWPVRLAFRSSRITLLDTLCRWQTLRTLAYLHVLASGAAQDPALLDDLRVVPGRDTAADPGVPELLARLERTAADLPAELRDAVVREGGGLLAGNRFAASVVAAGLTSDSRPSDVDEAVSRSVVLSAYWYESPAQRGGLALAWSANLFVRSWLWWSASFTYGDPAGGIGITSDPRPPRPAARDLPGWAAPLL
ncbi:hypothetical protein AB0F11_37535 [Streptomyces sp. NPDC032472]|uniref:hypothetical protein n=1 Tax=Streptomyces sp. NPDC032472 TaxID=3155018 RepID=UPI00340EF441